ncbi:serine protease snake-like isoform X2 [Belonocnema kinseyi]|uniref:serine protease snake-like isoform X2 n=1 Tax=Belonocnema kinseyi TaxID=2817044 RepID=UPI00143CC77C|nr:serine protease snake-like isoform X2 [Belonocnema kinseyi]
MANLCRRSQQRYVSGDFCRANTFSGTCLMVKDCPVVEQELVQGKPPQMTCGFATINDPIICCPPGGTIQPPTATVRPPTYPPERPTFPASNRIAERMCTEYSKAVYQMQQSPDSLINQNHVNASFCANNSDKLIVGGIEADPTEFPHMAAIGYDAGPEGIKWQCGGTLVSEIFVLTAAHCTSTRDWGEARKVRVGDLNLKRTDDLARPQERNVVQIIRHPNYRPPSQYHDIALLRLDWSVTFDEFVRPACLPTTPVIPSSVIAAGWGVTDWSDDEGSEILLKVVLSILDPTNCYQSYRNDMTRLRRGLQTNVQICAGYNGKDTCQGDSGGPLVIYNQNHFCMYTVVGVTSIGKLCGSNIPGLYTRVYAYLDWLEFIIWSNR